MAPATIDAHFRARIDTFVGELTTLVRQAALDAVHDALGTSATVTVVVADAPKRGPGRPRKSGTPSQITEAAPKAARRGKRGKRTPEEVAKTGEAVLAYIKANPGQSVEQIGKALGMKTKELTLPIAKLIEQKAIRTKGEKRGTRYFAAASRVGGPAHRAKGAKQGRKQTAKRRA